MKKRFLTSMAMVFAVGVLLVASACKSSGIALTGRGQVLKIDIQHPNALPEGGEDNLDITIANRGVNNIQDVLVDVELPPQLLVLDQTADRGITSNAEPGLNIYHFVIGNIQPMETSHLRFKVRTAFGTLSETGSVKVTAWQRNLPGDKLVETAVIKLRK